MQQTQDPRATVIKNVAEDQYLLEQILREIPPIEHITFDLLIDLFEKCSEIREEPEFIQAIFNKNTIYEEIVLWILEPLKMIEKRQKTSIKLPSGDWKKKYPYACMRIVKQNSSFYINLYLKAYFDESALLIWFQFLKQSNPETINTSLGYFTEIMLPFIKYEFSDSTKICQTLSESVDEDILTSSSEFARQQTSVGRERQILSNQKKRSFLEDQISILKIFSNQLLEFIFEYIEYQSIFKFLHNLILVSLEENDLKRSKNIFQAFFRKALQVSLQTKQDESLHISAIDKQPTMDICIEYILEILNEIYENANTQKNYRVIFFVDSIIRVKLIELIIQRIEQSFILTKQTNEEKMSSSMDFTAIAAEEEIIEFYLKSLTLIIKIYTKMVKNRKTEEQLIRQSKYYGDEQNEDEGNVQGNGQGKVMKQFSQQIGQIFNKLPQLSTLVKKSQPRVLAFSSGQNIKPITFCKYQFFQLIYNCLLLSREYPQSFLVDTQKINLFSLVEKYLQENRWNNLAHQILQKIACLLIKNNKNFFRTKQMNKNNMADEFLNSIIQSFTNKKHIFLNSLRFTNQGNIHTLYTIAKAIINQLKQSHKLANFVHELDYYKKFVMNDLQQYQTKIRQNKYLPDEQQFRKSESVSQGDQIKLFVDQLSVRQIVKKIQVVNKWPLKQTKRKHGSFIHRSLSYMSDQLLPSHIMLSGAQKNKKLPNPYPSPSQQLLNTQDQEDNKQDLLRPRYFNRSHAPLSPRETARSDIKSVDKYSSSNNFFGKSIKKVDSICIDKSIEAIQTNLQGLQMNIDGRGLFNKNYNKKQTPSSRQERQSSQIRMTYPPQNEQKQFNIHVFNSDRKMAKNISIEEREQSSSGQKSKSQIKDFSKTD